MSDIGPIADESLHCPLCGYALLGLTSRRCPECGHAFDPDALRAARDDGREDSFEHAPRVAIAFADVALRSLRPLSFWRRLSPAVPILPRRLRLWAIIWLTAAIAWAIFAVAPAATDAYRDANAPAAGPLRLVGIPMPARPQYQAWGYARFTWWNAVGVALRQREPLSAAARLVLAAATWPLATFLAIRLFAVTLRRAGVRLGHLGRVALFGWPSVMLLALVLGTLMLAFRWEGYRLFRFGLLSYWLDQLGLSPAAGVCLLGMMLLSTFHVAAAHVRYLRLPHAVTQSLLVAIVTWLAIAAVLLVSRQTF